MKGAIAGFDKFYDDALEMVTSEKARQAFDIQQEDAKLRENTAATTWAKAACSPGVWSKRAYRTSQFKPAAAGTRTATTSTP